MADCLCRPDRGTEKRVAEGVIDMAAGKERSLWILNHHATGPGRHHNLAWRLETRGWRVKLFASSFVHNVYRELREYGPGCFYLMEDSGGVGKVWIRTPPYRGNSMSRLLNHLVFAFRATRLGHKLEPPDLVIGSSAHLLTGLAAMCLAKKHGVPFIFEIRDIWPQSLVDIGAMSKYSPLAVGLSVLEKLLYRQARLIISALPGGAEHVAALGFDRDKVVYIPNGTDLAWYDRCAVESTSGAGFENLFPKTSGRLVFTYSGAHGYANGLGTVVEAAKILSDEGIGGIHILMVGDGPCKEGLVRYVREYGLNNITLMDAQEKNRIPLILKKSDVCLFHLHNSRAYKYGISSNKLFEYMAASRPMIAAVDVPLTPQFSRFGLQIPSDDPQSLVSAMLQMADKTPEERTAMGARARKYVERFHDVPVLADRLEEALEKCLCHGMQRR